MGGVCHICFSGCRFFLNGFMCLFFIALGLCCSAWAFSACGWWWWLSSRGFSRRRLLLLWSTGPRPVGFSSCSLQASGVVVSWLSGLGASGVVVPGLRSCGSLALECPSSVVVATGLIALWHVESSWARDRTYVPCIGRRILIHCTNQKGSPYFLFFKVTFKIELYVFRKCKKYALKSLPPTYLP